MSHHRPYSPCVSGVIHVGRYNILEIWRDILVDGSEFEAIYCR